SRVVKERAGGLLAVIRDAASVDAEIDALWQRIEREFRANQRSVVELLHEQGALRAGLDVERAADVLWALNHPSLWWLLVGERGWSGDEYEAWLADLHSAELLAPSDPTG
ncbi:MAG TPA: hypothetical protein VIU16_04300, partial [Gaiellaceae bacterium]